MATLADFDRAVGFVLDEEGGYVNDPADPGGETKYGISKRSYPWLDIPSLTLDQAKGIYFTDYWEASGASALPMPLALAVFDTAVNMGVSRAKTLLAQSGGDVTSYLNLREQYYVNLANANPTLAKFLNGWLARVARLKTATIVGGSAALLIVLGLLGYFFLRRP